jgi:hypothetical protein
MPVQARFARALMLVLLLPALLAPCGWSWHLCFCKAMRAAPEQVAACCRPEVPACCEPNPVGRSAHECGQCRRFEADNRGLPTSSPAPQGQEALALLELPRWLAVPAPLLVAPWPRSAIAGGLAPPGSRSLLPLRI